MDSSKGLVVEQQGTKDKVYKIYTAKGFAEFADSMNFRNSTSKSDINVVIMTMTSCAKPFEHTNEKSINNILFIENLF